MIPWYLDVIMSQLMQSWDFGEYTSACGTVGDIARLTEISRKYSGTVSSCIILYMWLMDASIWPAAIIDTLLIAVVTIFVITIYFVVVLLWCISILWKMEFCASAVALPLILLFILLVSQFSKGILQYWRILRSHSPLLGHVLSLDRQRYIKKAEIKDMFRPWTKILSLLMT